MRCSDSGSFPFRTIRRWVRLQILFCPTTAFLSAAYILRDPVNCSSNCSKQAIALKTSSSLSEMSRGKHAFEFGRVRQHSLEARRMTKPDLPLLAPRLHCQATRINFGRPNICPAEAAWPPFNFRFCRHEHLRLTMIVDENRPYHSNFEVFRFIPYETDRNLSVKRILQQFRFFEIG